MRIVRRSLLVAIAIATYVPSMPAQAPAAPARVIPTAAARPDSTARRSLEMADLLNWKNIRGSTLTNDGKWFGYQLAPNEGDSDVILRRTADDKELRFPVGDGNAGLTFSDNSQYALFTIAPTKREAERLRRDRRPVQ